MTELEKIAYARTYIEKLANGLNPLTGQAVPDDECINHVRVSRCLFYVSDILRQLVENGGIPQRKVKTAKAPFSLDHEARKCFRYSEAPIPISEITKRINELIQPEEMKKITYKQLLDWLIQTGFLQLVPDGNGKMVRTPTATGVELGIAEEDRQGAKGPYTVIVYNKSAQEFILDHLEAALESAGHPGQ